MICSFGWFADFGKTLTLLYSMPLVLVMEKGFDRGKNRISLFFVQSPDFFHGSPDFPLPGVGRSEFEFGRCISALKSIFVVVVVVRYYLRSNLKFCLVWFVQGRD